MIIMAVDYGESRSGIAVCDKSEFLAGPVCTIEQKNTTRAIEKIIEKANELDAELIVVGHPLNMDSTEGERSQKCKYVAGQIEEKSGIETVLWDERATTIEALDILTKNGRKGKKKKKQVDAVAATLILESYLNYRKANKK
jgi:putative Holliday junction resolvase